MKIEKSDVKKEIINLMKIRQEMYAYLDANTPKKENSDIFDFSSQTCLDAKEVYEKFYKIDYQARKLVGLLVNTYDIKF